VAGQNEVEGILAGHGRMDAEKCVGSLLQTHGTVEV
jgi:hypothetical protein